MFAKKSSRLEVRDVWPAGWFPNDTTSNSDDGNDSTGAAQVPRGAVTPKPDPKDVSIQKSAVEGPEPNVVGHSPDCWRQPAKWNTFFDPPSDSQVWIPSKQCRALAWKVSRGLANGMKVSRSEAFRAVQLVLLGAHKRLYGYHTKGPWMTMLVNAIKQLLTVDWDLLDDDYNEDDREQGVVSEDMANVRIGHRGSYDVPPKIWNGRVHAQVITQIRIWKVETSKFPVHPLTDLCKLCCKALLRDGLLRLDKCEGQQLPRLRKAQELTKNALSLWTCET